MYCIYKVNEISRGAVIRSYLERMDEFDEKAPLLADGIAYVTTNGDRYEIANEVGEVFFIGSDGLAGIERDLDRLKPMKVIVDGQSYESYKTATAPLVYHVLARKPNEKGVIYAAMQAEKNGINQGVWRYFGDESEVVAEIRDTLAEAIEPYALRYVSPSYKLEGIERSEYVPQTPYEDNRLRDILNKYKARLLDNDDKKEKTAAK